MIWFTILGLLAVTISYLIISTKEQQKKSSIILEKPMKQSNSSVFTARKVAESLIAEGKLLILDSSGNSSSYFNLLGPFTQELFSKYSIIQSKNGDFRLDSINIQPSTYLNGYFSIGNSEDWDIVQCLGDDTVFIVEGSESSEKNIDIQYPTIYHLIAEEFG